MSVSNYPLRDSAILDSGSSIHIFNARERFTDYRPAPPGDSVIAGKSVVPILGYGTVRVTLTTRKKMRVLVLRDVAYCENFATSLVSLRLLRRKGYWWDNQWPSNSLITAEGIEIAELQDLFGQFVIENNPTATTAAFSTRRTRTEQYNYRAPSIADAERWHRRLGHPGPVPMSHIIEPSEGVRLRGGPQMKDCEACAVCKMTSPISRMQRADPPRIGDRWAVDFLDLYPDHNGHTSAMLFTERDTGYIFDMYLKDREASTLVSATLYFLGVMEYRFSIQPKTIETDNELLKSKLVTEEIQKKRFIEFEPCAPNSQSQNGGAERSGGVVKRKGSAMCYGANLPLFLWSYIYRAAVYLHNRTPRQSLK